MNRTERLDAFNNTNAQATQKDSPQVC